MNQSTDIIIIGGGIIGLSLAVELKLHSASESVTVLSRNFSEAAAHVAAGMLAPQAEAIDSAPMLDLCLRSRAMYSDWTSKLESLTGIETGYWQCGILAPVYQTPEQITAFWLNKDAIHQFQPNLGSEIVGGWWYPEDSQVDNRRALATALKIAAIALGVDLRENVEVQAIPQHQSQVTTLITNQGEFSASHYILAAGAWAGNLLSVPVYPLKGQMLSVRVPNSFSELPLQRILFGDNCYIVPRRDGLIAIGATVEDVGFEPEMTPAGVNTLLNRAIRLYPLLKDFPIQEFWWGFRPATPDELPILGASPLTNLTFATGHYRNGILLAPITAKLITDLILEEKRDRLLEAFRWDRFGD
ncbi:glycine oxidase ThiO [Oscillatoria salina]|uniref:glycine oxidase ThiO n=1 Tax=Oscillatoria salina TaxID=331517 RepID=UPI0013B86628|nr:glycine oxidase ThiO [Oscillatoria salina]MBZ8181002.1 glycine oxidase ThiO [Oscillatoria salina IIICB1]NET88123.1 glycine oxidase ThiO [Kamptonema sp. SIO1D9]